MKRSEIREKTFIILFQQDFNNEFTENINYYLEREGYEISYLDLDKNGKVKISSLKELLRDDTILVTVAAVNSEIGIRQPIEEIAEVLKGYPAYFHVDATQAIGKIPFSFDNIDLVSFKAMEAAILNAISEESTSW